MSQNISELEKQIRAEGWYRKHWTAIPENSSFTSKFGSIHTTMAGWVGLLANGATLFPESTILAAMKKVERHSGVSA